MTEHTLDCAHRADADALATVDILTYSKLWGHCQHDVCKIIKDAAVASSNSPSSALPSQDDSDTDDESDQDESSTDSDNGENKICQDESGGKWSKEYNLCCTVICSLLDMGSQQLTLLLWHMQMSR